MIYKKLGSFGVRALKNTAIGAVAGAATGGFVAESHYKKSAAKQGAVVGAGIGALSAIPAAGIAANQLKKAYGASLRMARSLKKTGATGGEVGMFKSGVKVVQKGRVVFRRIRGRIIAIRAK